MKKIGLIGGMSWESTQIYYQLINQKVKEILGGFHSGKCVIDSVDFSEIQSLQLKNDWNKLNDLMVQSAKNLEHANADLILICANTMHLCSEEIIKNVSIPLIHIAEVVGEEIQNRNIKKILLLGTKYTMEKDFYKNILVEQFHIEVVIPNENDRNIVHNIIYDELIQGKIKLASKKEYQRIIRESIEQGVEGVVLGCTEIPLLIKGSDVEIPVFDTTKIHAESAVAFALE